MSAPETDPFLKDLQDHCMKDSEEQVLALQALLLQIA